MQIPMSNTNSTFELEGQPSSMGPISPSLVEPPVPPSIEIERVESRKQLDQLHPGNRFRLMAGMSLLPERPASGVSR